MVMKSKRLRRNVLGRKNMRVFLKNAEDYFKFRLIERAAVAGLVCTAPLEEGQRWCITKPNSCPCCGETVEIVVSYKGLLGLKDVRAVCANGLCGWCENSPEYM